MSVVECWSNASLCHTGVTRMRVGPFFFLYTLHDLLTPLRSLSACATLVCEEFKSTRPPSNHILSALC
ncbi:hypothetical protein KIN20_007394 [Parelaphostrongylus tenuis]|uniref:Uncharacterized protein n=1 Tax=Parelaphostrongylus tenuis TaxID=148309 RepID=A0AAD5QJ57_PARTN|nr:hypothetical protein KIN20_007394 [Parelaphostrongylus tenuis]